jgi:hypothetical protein
MAFHSTVPEFSEEKIKGSIHRGERRDETQNLVANDQQS